MHRASSSRSVLSELLSVVLFSATKEKLQSCKCQACRGVLPFKFSVTQQFTANDNWQMFPFTLNAKELFTIGLKMHGSALSGKLSITLSKFWSIVIIWFIKMFSFDSFWRLKFLPAKVDVHKAHWKLNNSHFLYEYCFSDMYTLVDHNENGRYHV